MKGSRVKGEAGVWLGRPHRLEVGTSRIDPKAMADRFPSQQEPKPHGIPPGEGEINGPGLTAEGDRGADHGPELGMAAGIFDGALLPEGGLGGDGEVGGALVGMDFKLNDRHAIFFSPLNLKGMERRGSRPGVDLGFDRIDAQIRESQIFTPTNAGERGSQRRSLQNHALLIVRGMGKNHPLPLKLISILGGGNAGENSPPPEMWQHLLGLLGFWGRFAKG